MKLTKKHIIGFAVIGVLLAGTAIVGWSSVKRTVLPSHVTAPLTDDQSSLLADSSRSVSVYARMDNNSAVSH